VYETGTLPASVYEDAAIPEEKKLLSNRQQAAAIRISP
jgi:hypothetical protein